MSLPGFGWISLSPSRLRARSLAAAAGACAVTAFILVIAVILDGSLLAGVSSLFAAAAAAMAWRGRHGCEISYEVRVDPEGRIWCRPFRRGDKHSDRDTPVAPQRMMGGAQIPGVGLSVRTDAGSLFIWADSLPAERFTLLCAYARWHVERVAGGASVSAGPQS